MSIVQKVEPVCSIPWIGQVFPLYAVLSSPPTTTINITKLSTSQDQFEEVMNSAGKGLGLAMDMWSKQHAVRDLTIRVKYSELKRKDELAVELDSLIALNTRTFE
jgi:hypothetical protein